MAAVFLMVFAALGLLLNFPVLSDGLFHLITEPFIDSNLSQMIEQFSSGYQRPDGVALGVITLLVFLSAFLRTSRMLLNFRMFLIAAASAVFSAELFLSLTRGLPFHTYTGLLFSELFLIMAFAASIFRIGSMKSLNSTLMGKPQTEGRTMTQTFSRFLSQATRDTRISIKAVDTVSGDFEAGQERSFPKQEVKIGRDGGWADLVVGKQWGSVSGRHARLRHIAGAMIYEPVSGRYAYGVNDQPRKQTGELTDGCLLNLVSGDGPRMSVHLSSDNMAVMHPRSLTRAGHIARDEFKRVQTSFKFFLITVLLGLPLFFLFNHIESAAFDEHIEQFEKKQQEFSRRLNSKSEEISRIEAEGSEKDRMIDNLKERLNRLKDGGDTPIRSGSTADESRPQDGSSAPVSNRIAKIIDIKFTSQRISIYFPAIIRNGDGRCRFATAFFARHKKKPYVFIESAAVGGSRTRGRSVTFLFIYPETWSSYQSFRKQISSTKGRDRQPVIKRLESYARRVNLLTITRDRWKPYRSASGKGAVSARPVDEFPVYLRDFIPAVSGDVTDSNGMIMYGFSGGSKFYSPVKIQAVHSAVIVVKSQDAGSVASGFLVKVEKNGRYRVVAVADSIRSRRDKHRVYFHRM